LVVHKNSAGSHIHSPTSRSNSPRHDKGDIGNFQLSVGPNLNLPTQNAFEPLLVTGKKQLDQCKDMIINIAAHSNQILQIEQSHGEVNCGTLDPISKQPLVLLNTSQHKVTLPTPGFSNFSPTK